MDYFALCSGIIDPESRYDETSFIYVDESGTMFGACTSTLIVCPESGFPAGRYAVDGSSFDEMPVPDKISHHTDVLFVEFKAKPFEVHKPIVCGEHIIIIGCDMPFEKSILEAGLGIEIDTDTEFVMFFEQHKSPGGVSNAKGYFIADHGYSIILSAGDDE